MCFTEKNTPTAPKIWGRGAIKCSLENVQIEHCFQYRGHGTRYWVSSLQKLKIGWEKYLWLEIGLGKVFVVESNAPPGKFWPSLFVGTPVKRSKKVGGMGSKWFLGSFYISVDKLSYAFYFLIFLCKKNLVLTSFYTSVDKLSYAWYFLIFL